MALLSISLTGAIQRYFKRAWMDLPQRSFKTPLANSEFLDKAVIPKNRGQNAQFRVFDHLTIETNGTDDSPKTYSENAEPSSANQLSAAVFEVSFEMIAAYSELGNVLMATDPVDLMTKNKEELAVLVRRVTHQLTNDRCVKPITANVLNTSNSPSPLPAPFKTVYAGTVGDFGSLTGDSVLSMSDFKKCRSLLRNGGAPGVRGDLYLAVIDEAVKDQLLEDPKFEDAAKRHEDMTQEAFGRGKLMSWQGMLWSIQDDPYRCASPEAGGALTTRSNSGAVHVAHVLGQGAMGYVDFGGAKTLQRRTLMPTFKVQDISKTGTGPSIGFRIPYQSIVKNRNRGLNVAGMTRYSDSIEDIA